MPMFESVLIANRGEIACRIIKTAKRMGLRTIAVYSDADRDALFVRMADEAYRIGPAPARESYLLGDKILEVAKKAKAKAIHPGYGFLSENAEFAEACGKAKIAFVGPPPSAIRAMGLKDAAKSLLEKAGVPVVPGYHGAKQDTAFLRQRASNIGYPVLIKAVAGGGGKGMRRVDRQLDFDEALASAQREAKNAFGDPRVLVEKYITAPRHIEVQVFADRFGNVVHLFERDCSLQRRHQKVIEEAPAPGMNAEMRAAMGKAATDAARAVGYVGAGTVEFIVDGSEGLRPDGFFFMEMNTRLQVEHPVTEAITGLDLVELQLRVAAGERLPFKQHDLKIDGHAVEARLYAEDPARGFLPSTGRLAALSFPQNEDLRVDTGVVQGDSVTPYYDPMIAKLIVHAPTREEALARLADALDETRVAGPHTNLAFLAALCRAPDFVGEQFDTGFIDRNLDALGAVPAGTDRAAAAAALHALLDQPAKSAASPWDVQDGFQLSGTRLLSWPVTLNGEADTIRVAWDGEGLLVDGFDPAADVTLVRDGHSVYALHKGRQTLLGPREAGAGGHEGGDGDGAIKAPMHGKIVAIDVKKGQTVTRGTRVAIVEAMKMEHALTAKRDGVVGEIALKPGDQIAEGGVILIIGDPA